MRKILLTLLLVSSAHAAKQPNILLILADDLGYGDIACYHPESKIPTPAIDQLATEGLRFTDAHSPSTVCTPTRYSLLTGRMAFRTGIRHVFTGVGGPCMITPDRLTLAKLLQQKDYTTALFGKWHVGMTFYDHEGNPINKNGLEAVKQIDYARPATGGPIDQGFDHFFGTVSCPTTDWLYAYVDQNRIPQPPTKIIDRSTLPSHFYSLDCRPGLVAPDFDLEEVDEVFLEKSLTFLKNHRAQSPEKPFFLFHSCQAVHLPSFPSKKFQGKTPAGPHGDFIFQFDAVVKRLLQSLDDLDFAENTLVIVTSDNGPELPTVQEMLRVHQHDGAHPWRGVKRDLWEGGHRVPLIIRWPKVIVPQRLTAQTVTLTDLMATIAEIVDFPLPENSAEDSLSLLPILTGKQNEDTPLRTFTLQETPYAFALRHGPWKYLETPGSGGNNYKEDGPWGAKSLARPTSPDSLQDHPVQLYHLGNDPGETTNLALQEPELVKKLQAQLDEFRDSGRSTPLPR